LKLWTHSDLLGERTGTEDCFQVAPQWEAILAFWRGQFGQRRGVGQHTAKSGSDRQSASGFGNSVRSVGIAAYASNGALLQQLLGESSHSQRPEFSIKSDDFLAGHADF
jgi:hypothetical protein